MAKFSQRSLKSLEGVHPNLVRVLMASITDTPIDFTITEGVRSDTKQQSLYAQDRTAPGPRVTNVDGITKKSEHQVKTDGYGHAVDLYAYHSGSVQVNDAESLKAIAAHIKSVAESLGISIEWGGDWKMRDYPHFQLKQI